MFLGYILHSHVWLFERPDNKFRYYHPHHILLPKFLISAYLQHFPKHKHFRYWDADAKTCFCRKTRFVYVSEARVLKSRFIANFLLSVFWFHFHVFFPFPPQPATQINLGELEFLSFHSTDMKYNVLIVSAFLVGKRDISSFSWQRIPNRVLWQMFSHLINTLLVGDI